MKLSESVSINVALLVIVAVVLFYWFYWRKTA